MRANCVSRSSDRAEYDAALLSSVDSHFKVESKTNRLARWELPVSDFLTSTEDYSGMNFGQLLTHLRPPKITPEQFVELKDRVEKLGKQSLAPTSSGQILSLLEKYDVEVPKEVVEGLLKTPQGGARKPVGMTAKQWLAAPKPEAPPDWSLITCKGLHRTLYKDCQQHYQPSLYYKLSRMHHSDTVRTRTATGALGLSRPGTQLEGRGGDSGMAELLRTRTASTAMSRVGTADTKSTRAQTAMSGHSSTSQFTSIALPKAKPPKAGYKSKVDVDTHDSFLRQGSGDLSSLAWTRRKGCDRRAAVHAASGIRSVLSAISRSTVAHNAVGLGMTTRALSNGRDTPWRVEKPDLPHLCIDSANNTYTTHSSTPRQTHNCVSQKDMRTQRYLLNELGSKIPMG